MATRAIRSSRAASSSAGLLLKLRFALDHYVNLRPTKVFPGVESPLRDAGEVDFVVVREGTEGPYVGNGGSIRVGTPHEIANEVSVNTAYGVERVVRFAFAQAQQRRKKLTLVHKTNVLVNAGRLWQRLVDEVATEFPDVAVDYLHVDAATIFMVTDPARFDVIVTDNLFGDILTDLAGAISGGIGLASSGNLNPDGAFPSMFEPVHGSAPDIAGKGIADPTAAILSAALLLTHLGEVDAAARVTAAVESDLAGRTTGAARTHRGDRGRGRTGRGILTDPRSAELVRARSGWRPLELVHRRRTPGARITRPGGRDRRRHGSAAAATSICGRAAPAIFQPPSSVLSQPTTPLASHKAHN